MKDTDVQAQNTRFKTQSVKQGHYTTPEPLLTAVQYSVRSKFYNCNHATKKHNFQWLGRQRGFSHLLQKNLLFLFRLTAYYPDIMSSKRTSL